MSSAFSWGRMGQNGSKGAVLATLWVSILLSCAAGMAVNAAPSPQTFPPTPLPPPSRRLLSGTGRVQMILVTYPPRYTNTSSGWSISWYAIDSSGNDCPSCAAFCTLNGVDQHCDVLKEAPSPNANGTYVSSKALSPAVEEGPYVLEMWGEEPNCGNACVNGTVSEATWLLHTGIPSVTFSGGPANHSITSLQTAVISFNGSDLLPTTLVCSVDSAPFADCTSTKTNYTITGLTPGLHSFHVQPTDAAGNVGSTVSLFWTVDLSPPTVTILQQPAALTNSPIASFRFQGAIGGSVARCAACAFACALDGAAAQPCAQSPGAAIFPALAQGAHNLTVTVTDPDGNLKTVTTVSWLVQLTGPTVTITESPPARTTADAASFAFTAADDYDVSCANCTFTCQLDTLPAQACTPAQGAKYPGLGSSGKTTSHVFTIVPTNQAGNVGAAVSFNWTVDLVLPTLTILTQPANLVNSTRAFVAFVANDSTPTCINCGYTCQLDGGPLDDCFTGGSVGQVTYLSVTNGAHELVITVTNPVGSTAFSRVTWTVDTIDPVATIDLGASPTNRNPMPARITFSKPCANLVFPSCASVSNASANATCGAGFNISSFLVAKLGVNKATVVPKSAQLLSASSLALSLAPLASGTYDVSVTLAAGACADAAGNLSPAAAGNVTFNDVRGIPVLATDIPGTVSVFDNKTYVVRRTNLGLLNFTVDFGNSVTGFAAKSIIVVGGTAGELKPLDDSSMTSSAGAVYSFSVKVAADGWVRVGIADSAATDTNGNPSLASETLSIQVDRQPPQFTLTSLSGYKTKDPFIGILITLSEVLDDPVLIQHLNVSNANVTSFAGDGGTYGLRVEALPKQLVTVNVPPGVVKDRAGNPNLGSDLLTVQHYVVPAAVTAAATTAATAVVSTSAVSTGASVAGSMGSAGIASVGGNLLGLFTVIQRFAMVNHLAIKQSVTLTEMTGKFQWANFDAALPFGLGMGQPSLQTPNATAPAAAPAAAPEAPARRRLLTSSPANDTDVANVVHMEDTNRQNAAQQLVSSVIGKVDQGWSTFDRVIGWSLLLVFGSTALHMVVVRLWRMWTEQTIPDILMFPRCEIMVIMLTVEGLAQACGLIIAGGTARGRLVGTIIFICVPGSIIAFFFYIVLYKIYKSQAATFVATTESAADAQNPELLATKKGARRVSASAVAGMGPAAAKRGALLGRVAAATPFGSAAKVADGKWEDSKDKHFVARYGVFFQNFRGFNPPPEPEDKKPQNARGKSAKKRAQRTWGEYLNYHGLGADKFRSCYFSVYLVKKMLFGLLFGIYGGKESWTQVVIMFVYSFFQLSYLMFFKPYLDRSIQAIEEIVLICESLSFLLAILVLWRSASGWAQTRLSDSAIQSLLLSAQLLSVLVQLIHQWYTIGKAVYSQRAIVMTKLRELFGRKASDPEERRTSRSLQRKRSRKSGSRRVSARADGEVSDERTPSDTEAEEERTSAGTELLPDGETDGREYGESGLPKARDSVESRRSARQAPALRRRSSGTYDAETEMLRPTGRSVSWTDARGRAVGAPRRKTRVSSLGERQGYSGGVPPEGVFETDERNYDERIQNREAHSKSDERYDRSPSSYRPSKLSIQTSLTRSEPGADHRGSPRRYETTYEGRAGMHSRSPSDESPFSREKAPRLVSLIDASPRESPLAGDSPRNHHARSLEENEPGAHYRGSPRRYQTSYEGRAGVRPSNGSPSPGSSRGKAPRLVSLLEGSPREDVGEIFEDSEPRLGHRGSRGRFQTSYEGRAGIRPSNGGSSPGSAREKAPRLVSLLEGSPREDVGGSFEDSEPRLGHRGSRGRYQTSYEGRAGIRPSNGGSSPGSAREKAPRLVSLLEGSPREDVEVSEPGLGHRGSPRRYQTSYEGRAGVRPSNGGSSPGSSREKAPRLVSLLEGSPRGSPLGGDSPPKKTRKLSTQSADLNGRSTARRERTMSNVSNLSSPGTFGRGDPPERPHGRRMAVSGSRLDEDSGDYSDRDGRSSGGIRVAPVVKASLQSLKKKAAAGRTVSRARSRADVEEPVYEWGTDEEDAELDRPAFMKPQYYV